MLFRTHLSLGVLAGLICFFALDYSTLSFVVAVIASILPDIDSTKSFIGNRFYLRPLQWIVKHRGVFHSFTLCFIISWIISSIYPLVAFAFFTGYISHLLLDSFTVEGIVPFWPLQYKIEGVITTGSGVDSGIFWILNAISVVFIVVKVFY